MFEKYTGTNVSVSDLAKAASALQAEYANLGYTNISVAIAKDRITNGVVRMNIFRGHLPQILISGQRYPNFDEESALALNATPPTGTAAAAASSATNAPASKTNVVHGIDVRHYEIRGDTLLSDPVLNSIFLPHVGTNVTVAEIIKAASDLQMAYRARGYVTVNVRLPQQQITNGTVRISVFEGKLSEITVSGNHYFSSNNIMRALPSLTTNILLNGFVFQSEVDRANANRDRQISPELSPGPEPNTSDLRLVVKDRLPLHGREELNNYNTPNTPALRLNTSVVYNNFWQLEHALGLQYSFSPEKYKSGNQWNLHDLPLIANYSGYYRLPLGGPPSIEELVTSNPGNFGYNEGSRQFRLPPPSGVPEANVFASRSTIDTGVESTAPQRLFTSAVRTIDKQDTHQDLTINEDLGMRLSRPLGEIGTIRSVFSGGLDYKAYQSSSFATNSFIFTEFLLDEHGNPLPPRQSITASPVPPSRHDLNYLPLNFRWDANRRDKTGVTDFGVSYSPNVWFSGGRSNLDQITGSSKSSGLWHVFTASLGREQTIYKEWKATLHADGQWASEPLISTEQFGIGGLAGVRGYHEGEVFGDRGWRVTLEPKSPPIFFGQIFDRYPMILRFSMFMDYGQSFLIDPQGRQGMTPLWGVGAGLAMTFGSHWEARVAGAMPLLDTPNINAGQGRFYFGIDAQF